ncbi:MAG: DUF1624 domain-containing protein [bacterium]|nr:DUF1624 domain-containing protein [bacterium]
MTQIYSTAKERIPSLDALRGFIMIIMALDHASYFVARVHSNELWGFPVQVFDSAFVFLLRFISHICAPGFFFLMGAGMIFFANSRRNSGWSEGKIIRFFAIRGSLLILLQLVVENGAWLIAEAGVSTVTIPLPGGGGEIYLNFGVLSTLGFSMIFTSFLLRINSILLFIIGLGSIIATQALLPPAAEVNTLFSPLLRLLVIPGHTGIMQADYVILPWFGITCFGCILAKALLNNRDKTFWRAFLAGLFCLLVFFPLRFSGGFGNSHPVPGSDWMSFLSLTKYPPSIVYLLFTLGVLLIILFIFSRFENSINKWGAVMLTFGKSALFFYICHLYILALAGLPFPHGSGFPIMFAAWLGSLALLFPLCKWFAQFKRRKSPDSVWRFF